MSSSAKKLDHEFTATRVWFSDDSLFVALDDGREVKVPLEFYPRLNKANSKQRENYKLLGLGTAIHWPDIDEDLSVEGIVLGIPARI
jgi:hypothetical protein